MIVSAALGLLLTSAAVSAETPPTVTVRYGDLDLRSDSGVQKLHARVRIAARAVCEQSGFRKTSSLWSAEARNCQKDAAATAEARMQLAVANARSTRVANVGASEFTVGSGGGK
jgi:UrcA family protein